MPEKFEVQTRSSEGELKFFDTFREALAFAREPKNLVWKISFPLPTGERIRLVMDDDVEAFVLEQMEDAIIKIREPNQRRQ